MCEIAKLGSSELHLKKYFITIIAGCFILRYQIQSSYQNILDVEVAYSTGNARLYNEIQNLNAI